MSKIEKKKDEERHQYDLYRKNNKIALNDTRLHWSNKMQPG